MKIKTNAKIQQAVDERQGHTIAKFVALHIPAEEPFEDSYTANDLSAAEQTAMKDGISKGLWLAKKYEKVLNDREESFVPKNFGIYLATQETTAGEDLLYFIGTPDEIVAKLNKVPATEV
jgi:hypothetical protein